MRFEIIDEICGHPTVAPAPTSEIYPIRGDVFELYAPKSDFSSTSTSKAELASDSSNRVIQTCLFDSHFLAYIYHTLAQTYNTRQLAVSTAWRCTRVGQKSDTSRTM